MIIIPILTNCLMFFSIFPVSGDEKTWIGFLGSFWGAIIGGIISGAITLIGVRLTIEEQRKLFLLEKHEKASYIYKKITPGIVSINSQINEMSSSNIGEQLSKVDKSAKSLHSIIKNHSEILMNTEFTFISTVESILPWLEEIMEYHDKMLNFGETEEQIKEDLSTINNFIQIQFKSLQQYIQDNSAY